MLLLYKLQERREKSSMQKHSLRLFALCLSIAIVPWTYQTEYTSAAIVKEAEVSQDEVSESDLAKSTSVTTGQGEKIDELTDDSDTSGSARSSSEGIDQSMDEQESSNSIKNQVSPVFNESFISPDDLGNEQWLMDEVTRQAQVSYPGSSVSKNDIPRSFLENVTSITFNSDSSIRGTIPTDIVNLVNLESLAMRSQPNVTGTIPENIGKLKNLRTIDLQLSGISGSIPDSIGQLSNLKVLVLHNLPLTGQIPSSIGNLSALTTLTITSTNINGSIPESIGNLVSLTSLSVNTNQNLTGKIPNSIGNLENLTSLQLNTNPGVSGQIPSSLGNLVNLRSLYLSFCNFSGRIPDELAKLRNISIVTLAGNRLTGIVPPDILETMPSIDLRNTGVTTNNNLSMENSLWGGTFGNTTSAWKLSSTPNKIKGTGVIRPFDSTQDSFFDLKRTQGRTSQTLFETHQYTIYAGNPDTGDIVYDGLADTSASFEARLGIDYYTVVLDEAQNNSNNVTRVNVDVPNLFAEVVPQKLILGDTLEGTDPKSLIQNVKLNGKVLSTDEYTVTVETKPDTSTIGTEKNAKVRIDHNQDYIELTVPVEVQWGSTILTRGFGNWSTGAYTYHPSKNKVTSSLGVFEGDGLVHSSFDNKYYSLDFYRFSEEKSLITSDKLYYTHEVNGQDLRYQAISGFGNNNSLDVSVGDVVKVYHREPGRLKWFLNETENTLSTSEFNTVYLELGNSGYDLLTFDRAKAVEQTVKVGTTPEEIDQIIGTSLDLSATKDVSIVGFMQYPDTSTKGTSKGTVRVEETLTTGKKVQYDYEVPFIVQAGDLNIKEITNGNFTFGETKWANSQSEIQAVGAIAPTITISDYSDTSQWSLYVHASPFTNQKNQELLGAQMTLKEFTLVNTVHQSMMVNSKAITLGASAQIVAAMSNPEYINDIENGETTLQIGSTKDNNLTGVSLSLPANMPVDVGEYQSTVTWELVGDPTL